MKVIIDLIEDIREVISNDTIFTLEAMALAEQDDGKFTAAWQSKISRINLDEDKGKLFLLLGKDEAMTTGTLLSTLNALSNKEMMYEVCVSYAKETDRIDSSLIGFGESLSEKKYRLFIPE